MFCWLTEGFMLVGRLICFSVINQRSTIWQNGEMKSCNLASWRREEPNRKQRKRFWTGQNAPLGGFGLVLDSSHITANRSSKPTQINGRIWIGLVLVLWGQKQAVNRPSVTSSPTKHPTRAMHPGYDAPATDPPDRRFNFRINNPKILICQKTLGNFCTFTVKSDKTRRRESAVNVQRVAQSSASVHLPDYPRLPLKGPNVTLWLLNEFPGWIWDNKVSNLWFTQNKPE